MSNPDNFFRPEAIAATQASTPGSIILSRPVSFAFYSWMAFAFATGIIALLFLGGYTRRTTVTGQLMPSSGLIKVQVPFAGRVLDKQVVEGQTVRTAAVHPFG